MGDDCWGFFWRSRSLSASTVMTEVSFSECIDCLVLFRWTRSLPAKIIDTWSMCGPHEFQSDYISGYIVGKTCITIAWHCIVICTSLHSISFHYINVNTCMICDLMVSLVPVNCWKWSVWYTIYLDCTYVNCVC